MDNTKILIIDDDNEIGNIFSKILKEDGYWIFTAKSANEAFGIVDSNKPDLIFLDIKLPDKNGIEVLRKFKENRLDSIIIMMTGFEDVATAVESMKLGAYDYLVKPIPLERIKIIINHALEKRKLHNEIEELKTKIIGQWSLSRIIGTSKKMQELFQLIQKIIKIDIAILIKGETGVGKELVARAIHYEGDRREKPFVAVDCASLPETLIESELFGYNRGAFTGANKDKPGKFEDANCGTIFLDEIGNLPVNIQNKLLRVLQEKEIIRLGSKKSISVDVRIITATNIDLESAIKKGFFREDLYHRINVFPILVPPLREREDDVILLSKHFLNLFSAELNKKVKDIDIKVLTIFKRYSWPGNVRELENVVKRAVILAEDNGIISFSHIPEKIIQSVNNDKKVEKLFELSKSAKKLTEKELIKKILEETNWNKSETARKLKVSYKTLYNKIKEYDIKR